MKKINVKFFSLIIITYFIACGILIKPEKVYANIQSDNSVVPVILKLVDIPNLVTNTYTFKIAPAEGNPRRQFARAYYYRYKIRKL